MIKFFWNIVTINKPGRRVSDMPTKAEVERAKRDKQQKKKERKAVKSQGTEGTAAHLTSESPGNTRLVHTSELPKAPVASVQLHPAESPAVVAKSDMTSAQIGADRLERRRKKAAARQTQPDPKPIPTTKPAGDNGKSIPPVAEVSQEPEQSDQDGVMTALALEALWQSVITPAQVAQVKIGDVIVVDPRRLMPNPKQIRKNFPEDKLAETAESMRIDGQQEPVKIYRLFDDPDHDWRILDGQRRWTCAQRIGMPLIAQVVAKPADRIEELGIMAILNTGEGHDHMEIVLAMQEFIAAGKSEGWIASKFVKGISWVKSYITCAQKLLPTVIEMLSSVLASEERLRFPVACRLVQFLGPRQFAIAQQVRGKTAKEASPIINRALGKEEDAQGRMRPSRKRGTLEAAIDGAIAQMNYLGSMPLEGLARIFAQVDSGQAIEVLESIEEMCDLGATMQERIVQSLPEPVKVKVLKARPSVPEPEPAPEPNSEPESESTPKSLNIEGLVHEVDPGLEAMLVAMDALAVVIMGQKDKLREIIEALPQEERWAVYERIEAAARAITWAKLRANQAGGERK